jgi:hypothetical protein
MRSISLIVLVTAVVFFLVIGSVSAVDVEISVDSSNPDYPSGVPLDGWRIFAVSSTITSLDPSAIAGSAATDGSGVAVLSLDPGTYCFAAVHYDSGATITTPLFMGTIMDNPTNIHFLSTGSETSAVISDYTPAAAIRGFVTDGDENGINGANVFFSRGTLSSQSMVPVFLSIQIPQIPVKTRNFGDDGYYAVFLPVKGVGKTKYTVTARYDELETSVKNFELTQGYGSSESQFLNIVLEPEPTLSISASSSSASENTAKKTASIVTATTVAETLPGVTAAPNPVIESAADDAIVETAPPVIAESPGGEETEPEPVIVEETVETEAVASSTTTTLPDKGSPNKGRSISKKGKNSGLVDSVVDFVSNVISKFRRLW